MSWTIAPIGRGGDLLYSQAGTPSLDLRFAEKKTLTDYVSGDNLVTFSRDSSGTYVDGEGVIQMAGHNLLTYSEEFNQSVWGGGNGFSRTANAATAPDGNPTADLIDITNEIGGGDAHFQQAISALPDGTACVFSFYIKSFPGLGNQTLYAKMGRNSTTSSYSFAITEDWQRISIVDTGQTIGTTKQFFGIAAGLVAGDTAKFYIWGAQLEKSAKVSPYLKTTTSTVAAPRFDHDPTTGESLGLLVEEARTNYLPYSQNINNWIKLGSATTPVDGVGLDGITTAYRVTPSVSGGYVRIMNSTALTPDYTYTVYAKSAGYDFLYLNNSSGSGVCFNLSTGIPAFSNTGITADMSPMGGGWYRCSATYGNGSFGSGDRCALGAAPNSSFASVYTINTGDGVSGVTVWGAQLEAGSFPTSYIPTAGTTVTRSADVASITGANFSSWYNQSEGTMYSDITAYQQALWRAGYVMSGSDPLTRLQIVHEDSQDRLFYGAASTAITPNTPTGSKFKAAWATDGTSIYGLANGSAVVTSANAPSQSMTGLGVGSMLGAAGTFGSGHISRLTYWPQRLPDATLQTITT